MKAARTSSDSIKQGAVIYCRVSTSDQVEGFSLEFQENHCREYCKARGWPILAVHVDQAYSARTADRPEFIKMMDFCKRRDSGVGHVVLYRLDRFSRNTLDYHVLRAMLRRHGVDLVSVTQPIADTPEGNLMSDIVAAFGAYESESIGQRARDGMTQARRNGRLTSPPAAGLLWVRDSSGKNQTQLDPMLAPIILEAFKQYGSGVMTKAEAVRHMNGLGYVSPVKKRPMTPQNLDRMLRNRVYAGQVRVSAEAGFVAGNFPALVPMEVFEAVQRRLDLEASRTMPRQRIHPGFPLRGFIRCGKCGRPLTAGYSTGRFGRKYGYYACFRRGCHGSEVRQEMLESAFCSLLDSVRPKPGILDSIRKKLLKVYEQRQSSTKKELRAKRNAIDILEARIKKLHVEHIDGHMERSQYQSILLEFQSELAEARTDEALLSEQEIDFQELLDFAFSVLGSLRKLWEGSSIEHRLALQRAVFPDGLEYSGDGSFRTPVTSSHFDILGLFAESKERLAGEQGFEPR